MVSVITVVREGVNTIEEKFGCPKSEGGLWRRGEAFFPMMVTVDDVSLSCGYSSGIPKLLWRSIEGKRKFPWTLNKAATAFPTYPCTICKNILNMQIHTIDAIGEAMMIIFENVDYVDNVDGVHIC